MTESVFNDEYAAHVTLWPDSCGRAAEIHSSQSLEGQGQTSMTAACGRAVCV